MFKLRWPFVRVTQPEPINGISEKYKGHTPGPWLIEETGISSGASVVTEADTLAICNLSPGITCAPRRVMPDKERQANARLIADVPMILKQNEKMLQGLARLAGSSAFGMPGHIKDVGADELKERIEYARSLIKDIEREGG